MRLRISSYSWLLLMLVSVICWTCGQNNNNQEDQTGSDHDSTSDRELGLVYENDFETQVNDQEDFWSEGEPAKIIGGHLVVRADTSGFRRSTIWFNQTLPANFRVECDAHVLASADTSNNFNFFVNYAHPQDSSLLETKSARKDANYPKYHQLNGYIFTYLANGQPESARFRFRHNPGFLLLYEDFKYEALTGKTYHFSITKTGREFTFSVDQQMIMKHSVPDSLANHQHGLFGFRTWHTDIWWDNLKIYRLD